MIPVDDEASVSLVRQRVRELGAGLDPQLVERAALVASELAHNQLRHGRLGEIDVTRMGSGLEVRAIDHGAGIERLSQAFSGEPHPDSPGLGMGLAGVRRLSQGLDVLTRRLESQELTARFGEFVPRWRDVLLYARPHPDERTSGDDAAVFRTATGHVVVVADGLGHGEKAREASRLAVRTVRDHVDEAPLELMERCDAALRRTRGAALAIGRIRGDELEIAIAGNIRGQLLRPRDSSRLPSVSRIVGGGRGQRFRASTHRMVGAVLLLASDGLQEACLPTRRDPTGWQLGLLARLVETGLRETDDATILLVH